MANHFPGETFVSSKGIKYVLDYGPKGNLRPYVLGPVKAVMKTKNPYIITGALVLAAGIAITVGIWMALSKTKASGPE